MLLHRTPCIAISHATRGPTLAPPPRFPPLIPSLRRLLRASEARVLGPNDGGGGIWRLLSEGLSSPGRRPRPMGAVQPAGSGGQPPTAVWAAWGLQTLVQ